MIVLIGKTPILPLNAIESYHTDSASGNRHRDIGITISRHDAAHVSGIYPDQSRQRLRLSVIARRQQISLVAGVLSVPFENGGEGQFTFEINQTL
jgi:hypothetical protein